jgi:hypothetical protein
MQHMNNTTQTPPMQLGVTLHPNLARIAVAYQDLVQAYASGLVDANRASVMMRELVARDDEGTQWTINPRDGGWLRCTVWGEWVSANPPQNGFATLSAWELSGTKGADQALMYASVDAAPVVGYKGLTAEKAQRVQAHRQSERPRWLYPVMVLGAIGFLLVIWLGKMDDGSSVTNTSTIPASAVAEPQEG